MIENLSLRCIWLYVIIMWRTSLGVNLHSIVFPSDSNRIGTHNHLVRKRTLNHLAQLAKWLSSVVSTYVYCAFIWLYVIITSRTSLRVNLDTLCGVPES